MTLRTTFLFLLLPAVTVSLTAATPKKTSPKSKRAVKSAARPTAFTASTRTAAKPRPKRKTARRYYNPYSTPTFAISGADDNVDGEDLLVRRAAMEALGPYNGSVVVADPATGRILTVVNQKLALTGAFTPCSTIKLISGLAGLMEGYIERDTYLRLNRRESMNLTVALARSNNLFFQKVGASLGFEKVRYYAHMFGLGEKSGLNIEGEVDGVFPNQPPKDVPFPFMCSHGSGIEMTPLQLTAITSSFANGGTLYYLQYPRTEEEIESFVPRVKRRLEVDHWLPEMKPGMLGSTEFGSGRRAGYDNTNEPVYGKTGTCSDGRTHLGWFTSFNEVGNRKLVVTVLLTGGSPINGPVASGIAGQVYKTLSSEQYFAQQHSLSPATLVNAQ